jgi:hypothetical protein
LTLTVNMMTRGRHKIIVETVKRTLPNIVRADTTFMLLVDDDDQPTIDALQQFAEHPNVLISVKPREDTRGEKYDRALTEAPADVYLPSCDYAPIMTRGFDQLILDAAAIFPDGIGVVYTEMANATFPAYQGVTAKLVEKIGYIYPPWFPFWFIDHWMDDLAKLIDRISYAPVAVDGTSLKPNKTIGLRDLEFWTWFFDAGRLARRKQAHDIINGEDFQETEWRKALLLRNHPLIEFRSYSTNQFVRNNCKFAEQSRGGVESEPDERYNRIKAKAEKVFRQWVVDLDKEAELEAAA